MNSSELVSPRRTRAVYKRLAKVQEPFRPKPRRPVVDELIMTVLSQHTSDTNTERAFASLTSTFSTWEEVLDAPVSQIEEAIRSGGLARQKAPRIKAILAAINAREGSVDLARLQALSDRDIQGYLTALPGVGPKTAACVLCFALGRAAFPVDTHVHRIALRLGWVPPKSSAAATQDLVTPRVPADIRYALHAALIHHGRTTCTARRPRCGDCVLLDFCPAGSSYLASGEAR